MKSRLSSALFAGLLGIFLWGNAAVADHHAPASAPSGDASPVQGKDKATAKGKQCPHAAMWKRHAAQQRAHHAKLHAALKLTEAQEAAWKTFTRQMAPRKHLMCGKKAVGKTAPERMDAMLGMMRRHLRATKARAEAVKAFYAVLTPAQQKTFDDGFMPHGFGHHRQRPPTGGQKNTGKPATPPSTQS